MQALFYIDMRGKNSGTSIELFSEHFISSGKAPLFFAKLVNGVIDTGTKLDSIIEQYSSNWKISRMSCVDRNIIRIALYEFLFCDDIPSRVSINEAIEIGKKYGTKDSGAFINGIMDSICKSRKDNLININNKI